MKQKKVIFIDWNKTLSFDLFWGHLQDTTHPLHKHVSKIEKWLFLDHRDVISPWMRGEYVVEDIVGQMHRDTGVDSHVIFDELKKSCEEMTFCVSGIEELIREIRKKGIKVVIATDNMDTFPRFTVPSLELDKVFDGILDSHTIKHLKDDEKPADKILFFDQYLTENNYSYKDVVLLDDSPDSTGKYDRLGFERILIDGPESLQKILEEFAYGQ
jgi:FMN phosphatase YigB (HAD superfamily)